MKIRVLGGGFYGCHIAKILLQDGYDVEVHEIKEDIFCGASGKIPARLHEGFHYPRSKRTRDACQQHLPEFMAHYSAYTREVDLNLYAIAEGSSMVDYPQYVDTLRGEVLFTEVDPEPYGLIHVEGALATYERHIHIPSIKAHFKKLLGDCIKYDRPAGNVNSEEYDLTIDATFCANEARGIDRYEPCIVGLLEGPADIAVTIMDGPFGSLYPWDPKEGLSSLSSAKWSPFSKSCRTWNEAKAILDSLTMRDMDAQLRGMFNDLAYYYPALEGYTPCGAMLSIRAMPLSGADSRLIDVIRVGTRSLRVRAGKIDAICHATDIIKRMMEDL